MRVLGIPLINDFARHHEDVRQDLSELVRDLESNRFAKPSEVHDRYPSAKVLDGRLVVFKIRGNHYRVVTRFAYNTGVVIIEFVGTHQQYDRLKLK
jgi:mRNA interferase HigB